VGGVKPSKGTIMAVFSKNTLTQVSGFSNAIIAGELVYNQQTFWNLTFQSNDAPVDLTGATINAQILRRLLTDVIDTRNGLSFNINDYVPTPTAINLTVTNRVDALGQCTLIIDSAAWGLIAGDAQLDIAVNNPVGYSGRVKVSFPASGATPAEDQIIFLLFLVRSDGVIN
jgi:hypothetical protein